MRCEFCRLANTVLPMVFQAAAVRVMIASPSDIPGARDAVEQALHDWNQAHAHHRSVVLMPWRWENSSVPLLGQPAQSIINAQGLDQADVVFVLFGTKLGTKTATAVSGTVEELVRASEQGKPVHVYFSQEAVDPNAIDPMALAALREYKHSLEGLYSEFSNVSDLTVQVWRAIEHDMGQLQLGVTQAVAAPTEAAGVAWSVDHESERELKGYSNRGKPQYTTRHQIVVTNRGPKTALAVTFQPVPEDSRMHLATLANPSDIYPGQSKRLNAIFTMGGSEPKLKITWTEDGEERSEEFFVN